MGRSCQVAVESKTQTENTLNQSTRAFVDSAATQRWRQDCLETPGAIANLEIWLAKLQWQAKAQHGEASFTKLADRWCYASLLP